jgi:hypothetical protein
LGIPVAIDRELGVHDLAFNAAGAAQIAAERDGRLAGGAMELIRKPRQHNRVLPGRDAVQKVAAAQLLERVAEHLAGRRIGVDKTPVSINHSDPILGAGHHAGKRSQTQRRSRRDRAALGTTASHTIRV